MFCKKCGSLLIPKKGEKTVVCSCGFKTSDIEDMKLTESTKKKDDIVVVDKDFETAPLTEEECPKCGHRKAFYWLLQTRAADEAETKFLKCEKCKHTWRDAS